MGEKCCQKIVNSKVNFFSKFSILDQFAVQKSWKMPAARRYVFSSFATRKKDFLISIPVWTVQKTFFNQLTCWLSSTNLIPRGTIGSCCAHIDQLMTHAATLHMAFYLALMLLKTIGIFHRVTKSQKVHHISNRKIEIK